MVRQIFLAIDRRLNLTHALQSRLHDRRFWRNSGLLMLANLIVTGLALVRTPLMTWLLPKEQFGMLGVIAAWLPFLQLASLSGLDGATYHYVAKGQPWAFVVTLFYRLRWSLLSSAGFLAGAALWAWQGQATLAWLFAITGLTYPVTTGMTASAGMLGAQEKFRSLFWYRIGESLTDFAGFIPLALSAWWVSQVVTFYAANQLATALMQAGVSFWIAWQLGRLRAPRLPVADERSMLQYGKHLTVMNGIGVVQTRTDALVVGSFLPLSTMADYSIALIVYEQFKRLWVIYGSVRYPPLVRLPAGPRFRRMIKEGVLVWTGFALAGLVLALLARLLIPIFLPPSYAGSFLYIDWLLAAFVVGVPGFLAEMYFRTQQDEKRQYAMRSTAAMVGLILPAALVFRWGAAGVVFGRFLASLTLSLAGVWLALRWHKELSQSK